MTTEPTIVLQATHRYTQPAQRVYAAWLDPDQARQFLFTTPTGEMVRAGIDPSVGGHYSLVDRRDGEDVEHCGDYLELEPSRRIVMTLRVPKYSKQSDRVVIDLIPAGSGCELTLAHEVPAAMADRREMILNGWQGILEKLEVVLNS
ncbi:MAG: SRPBCC family protein [Planctomycetota bacterium]|nr:SRPBCC family protein [Planctomycetota bacterium]